MLACLLSIKLLDCLNQENFYSNILSKYTKITP